MPTLEELLIFRRSLQEQLASVSAEIETTRAQLAGVLSELQDRQNYKAQLKAQVQALQAEIQQLQG